MTPAKAQKNIVFSVTPPRNIFFCYFGAPGFFLHFRAKSMRYMTATGRSRVVLVLLHVVHRSLYKFFRYNILDIEPLHLKGILSKTTL